MVRWRVCVLPLYRHRSLPIWYRALGSDGGTSAGCSSSRLFARARSCAGTGAAYPLRHLECDSRTFLRVWGSCLGQERLSMRECCILHHAIFALDLLPFIGIGEAPFNARLPRDQPLDHHLSSPSGKAITTFPSPGSDRLSECHSMVVLV